MKVADFGLARAYADGKATQAGGVQGTVQYLSPEQIRGEPADPRSDLYSLGIVDVRAPDRQAAVHRRDGHEHRVQAPVGPRAEAVVRRRQRRPRSWTGSSCRRPTATASSGPRAPLEMRRDLESIAAGLPAARSLAAVAGDMPEVSGDGAVTERVPLVASTTQTIPRAERTKRRRMPPVHRHPVAGPRARRHGVGRVDLLIPHHADVPPLDRHPRRRREVEPHRPGVQGEDRRRRRLPPEHPGGKRCEHRSRARNDAREGRDRHAGAVVGSEAGARSRPGRQDDP